MSADSSTLRSQITKSALHPFQVLANIGPKSKRNAEQTGIQDPQDEQWLSIGDVSENSQHKGDHGPEDGQSPSIKDIKPGHPEHKGDHGPEEGQSSHIKDIKPVNLEHKGDPEDGQSSSIRDPSPKTPPQAINVVLFGETGVGKSSVINLIARKDIAKVSSDVNGCTMQSHCYYIPFDNMNFAIYDTIGLEEPQMGVNGYLKAIEKAHELISKLSAAGGIHLLLFCMRGGRITATTQSNYRLFCECLCNTKVPIALVFTGLEREVEMEDWWKRNKTHIEHYGIKSNGHACITAVQDDDPVEQRKYEKSQETIRELLKSCATKGEAFSLESHSWFAGFSRKMKAFLPGKKSPKKKDILKVLTNRCKLDVETAKRIAEMMDKSDKDEEGGGGKDGPTKSPTMNDTSLGEQEDTKATSGISVNRVKEIAQDGGPPQELGNVKAVPDVVTNGEKGALPQEPSNAKASTGVVPVKEIEKKNVADTGAQLQEPSNAKVLPGVAPGKEVAKKNVVDAGARQDSSSIKTPSLSQEKMLRKNSGIKAVPGDLAKKNMTSGVRAFLPFGKEAWRSKEKVSDQHDVKEQGDSSTTASQS